MITARLLLKSGFLLPCVVSRDGFFVKSSENLQKLPFPTAKFCSRMEKTLEAPPLWKGEETLETRNPTPP